jgi:hypothetical protein
MFDFVDKLHVTTTSQLGKFLLLFLDIEGSYFCSWMLKV